MELSSLAWPEVPDGSILVVAVGSCEQHGPHLPFDTDTRIAVALVEELVRQLDDTGPAPGDTDLNDTAPDHTALDRIALERTALDRTAPMVIGPPIGIGASGEHEGFPGTLSIGTVALEAVLVELVRSALPSPGSPRPARFRGVVWVNGHGGNVEAMGRAAALLSDEGRPILAWHPRIPDGDSHAGRTETSLLLHLDPGAVRMDRAAVGSTARWRDIGDIVVAEGLAAVTPNGVLGDPTGASAAEGATMFERLAGQLRDSVVAWRDTLVR